ncbi:MAG TPA: type II toxin-antitoxin system RelE/ParE family toxin [Candidatus Sulfotelmatobacter sp.]|jgi:phage-related protein|nr:type II toxin-antitoxin system RelE/ParE family toxin [Candidatus Sulfotelmatobacter sp.]
MVKPAIFHPAARETIRSFPVEVRKELGKAVYDLQRGETLSMPLSRPMTSIAPGAAELRIRDRFGIYRVFYYVKSARGVLIFHAFVKKTRTAPLPELNIGRKRLKELRYEED